MDLAQYRALVAKVDAFFERVRERHGDRMRCASGCSACCGHALTLSPVEAESVRAHVATLPDDVRARLAKRARRETPCPALDDDGRCAIYEARPIICRTQGVPMRVGSASLPVVPEGAADANGLSVCPLNFEGVALASLEPDVILDLENVDVTLGLINGLAMVEARGARRTLVRRVPIGNLLAGR